MYIQALADNVTYRMSCKESCHYYYCYNFFFFEKIERMILKLPLILFQNLSAHKDIILTPALLGQF